MNDFDNRQLLLMKSKINDFLSGKIKLGYLINDLEALLNIMETADSKWKNEFLGHWWDLEQVYSVLLARERTHYNDEEIRIIEDAIKNLMQMIHGKLRSSQDSE